MSTNLKIAYPDIPFNAVSVTSSETYDTDYPARNLISGSRANIARLAAELIGQHEIEFDLGSGVSQACDYVALVNAKRLKASGVDYVRLRGSSVSYQYPTSMIGIYDPERDVTYDSQRRVSQVSDQSGNSNHATQSTDANKPLLSRADNKENYLKYSEDWSNAAFTSLSLASVTANAIANSQGLITATKITAANASSRHTRYQDAVGSARPTGTSCREIFRVKKSNHRYIWVGDHSHTSWHGICFDFDTATLGTSANLTASSVEALNNGWYEIIIEYNVSDTASCGVSVYFNNSNATSSPQSFLAAGTEEIYIECGAWQESAADSEYISTTAFAEIRGINGNRCLVFDGSNDYLLANGLATALAGSDKPFTLIVVGKQNTTSGSQSFFTLGSSAGTSPVHELYAATTYRSFRRDDAASSSNVTGSINTNTNLNILTFVFSGTDISLWVNSTNSINASAHNVGTCTFNRAAIGAWIYSSASEYFNGKIAFMAVASSALGTSDRQAWENYLTNRFSTTPIADIDLQNVDLTGGQNKDYITTFTESAAYRYYIAQFITNTASSKRELSKLYFGKLFDMGRDPQLGASGSSNYHQDKGMHHYKSLTMNYRGVTTTKRQEFESKIGQYKDTNEILLHTTSYDAPLLNTDLLSVQIRNAVFQMLGASQNDLNITVEESY